MRLKKAIIVFFLILSFEGSGFAQMAQMSPPKPSSEEINAAQPSGGMQQGIEGTQRLTPQQLKHYQHYPCC
jgi:hypothetical protein